ncbi:MAG: hypothetical protein WC314_01025 [Vulcanimicrobiota bacterium]
MMEDDELGFVIADKQLGSVPEKVRRIAFVEGTHSGTKVATPDPIEDKGMKVANPEQPPGVKVASPEKEPGHKVVTPPGYSVNGDFRRTIRVSGEDAESRQKCGLKLYGSSLDPTFKPRRR